MVVREGAVGEREAGVFLRFVLRSSRRRGESIVRMAWLHLDRADLGVAFDIGGFFGAPKAARWRNLGSMRPCRYRWLNG